MSEAGRAARRGEPGRPRLHFAPTRGWVNDPHGLTFVDGRYHLFFQHVPDAAEWRPEVAWGHAVSDDLLHWTEQPVALAPGGGDDGVWSGCVAVPDDGTPVLFFTSVRLACLQRGRVREARPTDDSWMSWVKGATVVGPPSDLDVVVFRDPFVFRDGDRWRMIVGAGLADGTAAALGYVSDHLTAWTYSGPVAQRHSSVVDPVWTGTAWECPQLVRIGGWWVLTVSVWADDETHHEVYAVGDLVDGVFAAESWGRLTYGPGLYAGSVFVDAHGEPGMLHWVRGAADPGGRWAGAHSLPHRLRLEGDRVLLTPHPSVAAARSSPGRVRDGTLAVAECTDLEVTLEGPGTTPGLVAVGDVRLRLSGDRLTVDTGSDAWSMPATGRSFRVVLDGPVAEVFTGGGTAGFAIPAGDTGREVEVRGAASAVAWELG